MAFQDWGVGDCGIIKVFQLQPNIKIGTTLQLLLVNYAPTFLSIVIPEAHFSKFEGIDRKMELSSMLFSITLSCRFAAFLPLKGED